MTLPDQTQIADTKTVADWVAMKSRLSNSEDQTAWSEAFNDFFKARLKSRYFEPVSQIESMDKNVGEGFAIVALHCSLIEFLASTLKGVTYRFQKKNGPSLAQFEYSNSSDLFVKFLEDNEPFKSMFSKAGSALDFYRNVRCGLLHEARTKGRWLIRKGNSASQAIDVADAVVYRIKMQAAFDQFIERYGQDLLTDNGLQEAFIRKFDSLCEE